MEDTIEATIRSEIDRQGLPRNEHLVSDAIRAVGKELGIKNPFKSENVLSTDQAKAAKTAFAKFLEN